MRALLTVLSVALAACLLTLAGCRCSDGAVLATLENREGQVDRDRKAQPKTWSDAAVGATFSMGDAVRTREAATAVLALDDGSQLSVRPKTVLRFSDSPPKAGEQGFDVETGAALLDVGDAGLILRTSLGLARIDGKSQVLIRRTTEAVHFDVQVGRAVLETMEGKRSELEAGDGIVVGVGEAVLDSPRPSASAVASAPPEAPAELAPIAGDIAGHVVGEGVSVKRPTAEAFAALAAGAVQVPSGSMVKVKQGSTLTLQNGGASAALAGNGTYLVGGAGGTLVQVQQGSVAVSGSPTRIVVPGGVIVTSEGAAASVETLKQGSRVRVSKNHVSVDTARGTERVDAGQEALLAKNGAVEFAGKGLGYADIVVNSGESVVVHDPKPPTAVRFLFRGSCPEGGTIRVQGKRAAFASGSGSVALAFAPGRHAYALHCLAGDGTESAPASRGTLTIMQDAGTRPMPQKPPSTGVEVDGRTYTVMYQNQLPAVALRWSTAPAGTSFVLSHRSAAGNRSYKVSAPSYSFRSGALPEGSHVFYFEGGGKVSRQTSVQIRFDNSAPTASLQTPVALNVKQGELVNISGVAQPGWRVEINGTSADLDGQQRFSQKAEMPKDERALAVRLTHPQRGTHIYVRRAANTQSASSQ
ncbi:MAG TPA: hypothetical protein VFU02_09555 [Polyangiaceae bacterium]|nr:hypothetical protein [Polyangiaceae bacterium]